ncbi:amino acid adenylation domain-containing protein [Aquimarina sp. ERC-38]|uniref:non-ribosomal peptide synthetase n=1 Tax=Aquimarina sp. ERC-38 TaxID=2949996 RepID=UPI002246BA40|nr:amino acid adenylation domain-containing protein [Aquimarina sp. ERC-38]UZO79164.1 amino acid adenylation domain-containing protein [Aquimarina sp. ERC-38]
MSNHFSEIIKNNKDAIIHFFENDFQGIRSVTPITRESDLHEGRIPLSYSQERLWFIDALSGSSHYHVPVVMRINGVLDITILERSFQLLLERHQVLRTVIKEEDGIAYQEVKESAGFKLSYFDNINPGLISERISSVVAIPFDLGDDYMLRASVYGIGTDQYCMVLVMHHIASDGWSIPILFKELQYFYDCLASESVIVLPDLPIQYSDYSIWQRSDSEVSVLSSKLSFWQETLGGVPVLELPTDYIRPSVQSTKGSNYVFSLDSGLSALIRKLSQSEDCSLFMFLLASYTLLLHRYTGQYDISVGTPVANRPYQEIEGLIGFFVNTLVLRNQIDEGLDFLTFLGSVKRSTLLAYDHQEVPFEKLVSHLGLDRDQSRSPLFQTMLVLQNNDRVSDVRFGGASVNIESYDYLAAKEDLTLYVGDSGTEIGFSIEYCTDLFKESTIIRMADHFKNLIESIVASPTSKIGTFELLSTKEKYQLLKEFNANQLKFSKSGTVLDLFKEQTLKNPEAIAVHDRELQLSYEELDKKSDQIAKHLIRMGVDKEALIPICMDRSGSLVMGILGILKSGAAYVPVDPRYPEDRIQFIINNTNAKIILATPKISSILEQNKDLLIINPEDIKAFRSHDEVLLPIVHNKQLAYVIYTSGTTGVPKGVMIEHKALMNLCQWHVNAYDVNENSRSTLFSGIGFDASVWELFPYIISGSCLYPIADQMRLNMQDLRSFMRAHSITHAYCPTSLYKNFASGYTSNTLLKLLIGGESLKKIVDNESIELFNNYGPTENAVVTTYLPVKESKTNTIPIGKSIANVTVYILDDKQRICPIGIIGELYVTGDSLARGYLNDAPLTTEKFLINPFDDKKDTYMYRTGDLVKWLPDGTIEFIGRKDSQIKIRGYRIELSEIEHQLISIQGIMNAIVTTKKRGNENQHLVGYYTGKVMDSKVIKKELKKKIPEYMIPQVFMKLEEIPLTPNGKIDMQKLPELDSNLLEINKYVAPVTNIEIQIVDIWKELLEVDTIGIRDNFFELGGHSLMAIRLASKISSLYGFNIKVQVIFEYGTVENISKYIEMLLPKEEKEIAEKTFDVFSI